MDAKDICLIAESLLEGRRKASPVVRPSSGRQLQLDDGYAIADEMLRVRLAEGHIVVGAKLGFTNPALWEKVGLSGPLWAPVFDSTYTDADNVVLPRMRAPEVEPEIVFGIHVPPNAPDGDFLDRIEWWALGLEVIDTGYPPGPPVVADQAADFCAHQKLIIGEKRVFDPADVTDFASELWCDGMMVSAGSSESVMGNPLNAARWFIEHLANRIPWPKEVAGVLTSGRLSVPPAIPSGTSKWEMKTSLPLSPLHVAITRKS